MNQVETHPFQQQTAAAEVMKEQGVQHEAWGPFAEGKNDLFENPVLSAIARDHDRSVAQVVLRWLLQRGVVVIPKSVRKERIAENLDVFDFELGTADMERIASLDTGETLFFSHTEPAVVRQMASRRLDI